MKIDERYGEVGMQKCQVIFERALSTDFDVSLGFNSWEQHYKRCGSSSLFSKGNVSSMISTYNRYLNFPSPVFIIMIDNNHLLPCARG